MLNHQSAKKRASSVSAYSDLAPCQSSEITFSNSDLTTEKYNNLPINLLMSLSVRGSALPDSFYISVKLHDVEEQKWLDVGSTEMATNLANKGEATAFCTKFAMDYLFEEKQNIIFELYEGCTKLGHLTTSLGEIVYANFFAAERYENRFINSKNGTSNYYLQICTEESKSGTKENLLLQFMADHLPTKMFKKHSFFFELHRVQPREVLSLVHRSQIVTAHKSAAWPAFSVTTAQLCGNNLDETLRFSLWRRRRNGITVKFISFFNTSARTLMEGSRSYRNTYRLEKRCTVRLARFERSNCRAASSILESISINAVKLHCVLAVDFTSSNGPSSSPNSLHHLRPGQLNPYQISIRAVLEVLQDYDEDKIVSAFGFGALDLETYELNNRFSLNGCPGDPSCLGLENVMVAYERSVRTVRQAEPGNFEPIIRYTAKLAAPFGNEDSRDYYVLVIVTDGVMNDFLETINAVTATCNLPVSILIVGVGNLSNFSSLRTLNAGYMKRQIVNFVAFNDVAGDGGASNDVALVKAKLAKELLRNIPQQIHGYLAENFSEPTFAAKDYLNISESEQNLSIASLSVQQLNRSY